LSDRTANCVDFSGLSALEVLDLTGNKFSSLPSGINFLPKLRWLSVQECKYLISIPDLSSSLEILIASFCKSLKRVGIPIEHQEELYIDLYKSYSLEEIQGIEGLSDNFWNIDVDDHHNPSPNKLQKNVVEVIFLSVSLAQ